MKYKEVIIIQDLSRFRDLFFKSQGIVVERDICPKRQLSKGTSDNILKKIYPFGFEFLSPDRLGRGKNQIHTKDIQ